ncbi:hypothetical protein BJY00DRAFT_202986 [Aspergillus carlsbadensis]|nr:hypothetical protein BJY00DRAFT_202986 [Aspergillus carlsbadensis]
MYAIYSIYTLAHAGCSQGSHCGRLGLQYRIGLILVHALSPRLQQECLSHMRLCLCVIMLQVFSSLDRLSLDIQLRCILEDVIQV